MRFHLLGLPHTVTSKEFNACAYTQKIVKFGKMMKARGHEIIHYGHEDSDLICDEHVTVITNDDWKKTYGDHDWRKSFFKFDTNDSAYQTFYKNAIIEVAKRKQKNDFLLPFWGSGVRPICDAHEHDMIVVEPGIGYPSGQWARWKVFESYAIYHAYCGMENVGNCRQDWYEAVIPNYFDLEDFEYCNKKEDYFLYLGRVYDGKGVHIAIDATRRAGVKLVIAGQKEEGYNLPDHVEYVGYADVATRKRLMSKAKASLLPSMYIEPFGGVQIENLLSGTPTITTDWGSFTENNLHGVTGYRCRTMEDFVQAIKNIYKINPINCREWGENFSLEKVGEMYEKYFQDVLNVYTGEGWYEPNNSYSVLNALEKKIPYHPTRCNFDNIAKEELPFAQNLAKWVGSNFINKKIIDIGCGPGIYVNEIKKYIDNVKGYDIDERILNIPNLELKNLFELDDPADLVICLEVAEHINSEQNDNVVENICRNIKQGGTLLWTAAIPDQGGDGHINCQTRDYWLEKFVKKGLLYNAEKTNSLKEYIINGPHMGWFVNNLIIFEKEKQTKTKIHTVEQPNSDITTYIVSCGRLDLLEKTINSFLTTKKYETKMVIVDDSATQGVFEILVEKYGSFSDVVCFPENRGLWWSMDFMVSYCSTPYIFYLEDDWELTDSNYISRSKTILEKYRDIGIVDISGRTFENEGIESYDTTLFDNEFYYKKIWKITPNHYAWYGWVGSPNLRRREDLILLGRAEKYFTEWAIDRKFKALGFKAVYLKDSYIHHLGDERSIQANKRKCEHLSPEDLYPEELKTNRTCPVFDYKSLEHEYDLQIATKDKIKRTFITALLDIGREDIDQRNINHYLNSIKKICKTDHDLIVFTDVKYQEQIQTMRGSKNIKFIDINVDTIHNYRHFDKIKDIVSDPLWYLQSPWMQNSVIRSPEYITLTHLKFDFIATLISNNFLKTETFFWIDSGIYNSFNIKDSIYEFNFDKLNKEQFVVTSFPYSTETEIHGYNINGYKEICNFIPNNVYRASFFGSDKKTFETVYKKYNEFLETSLEKNYIGTEESIMTGILGQIDNVFEFIMPNGDINNFLSLLKY